MQITRAFTTPLIATMSDGKLPDPRNIRNVMRASFDMTEWASVVEDVGAHPIGGMRFNSFRYTLLRVCYLDMHGHGPAQ